MIRSAFAFKVAHKQGLFESLKEVKAEQPALPGFEDQVTGKPKREKIPEPKFPETDDEAKAQGYDDLEDFLQQKHLDDIAAEGLKEGTDFDWVVSAFFDGERKAYLYPSATSEEDAVAQFKKQHGDKGTEIRVEKIEWKSAKQLDEDHTNYQPEPVVKVVGKGPDGDTFTELYDGRDESAAKDLFKDRYPDCEVVSTEILEKCEEPVKFACRESFFGKMRRV